MKTSLNRQPETRGGVGAELPPIFTLLQSRRPMNNLRTGSAASLTGRLLLTLAG